MAASRRPKTRLPSTKNQIIFTCFLATFIAYVERVGFSIAFTAISQQHDISKAALGGVLSAFYWGYGLSQVSLVSHLPLCISRRACPNRL